MKMRIRREPLAPYFAQRPTELQSGVITFCPPLGEKFRFLQLEVEADGPVLYFEETAGIPTTTRLYVYAAEREFIHNPADVSLLGSFVHEGRRLFVYGPKDHTAPEAALVRR